MSDSEWDEDFFGQVYKLETVNECQSYYEISDECSITEKDKEFFKKLPYPIKKAKISEDGSRVFYISTFKSYLKDNIESLKAFCENIDAFIYIEFFCDTIDHIYEFHEFINVYIGYRENNTISKRFERNQKIVKDISNNNK